MANEFRITAIVFTQNSLRGQLQAFIGDLICNGWEGPVPIAALDPDPDNLTEYDKAWGGYLYPDMRLMVRSNTGTSRNFRTEEVLLGTFAHSDCLSQCEVIIGSESYPGFSRPQSDDAVVIWMTDSRFAPPFRWIQRVVDGNYETGLRFFFACYDLGDAAYGRASLTVFYSADANLPQQAREYLMAGSQHCIAIETTRDIEWKAPEEPSPSQEGNPPQKPTAVSEADDFFANLASQAEPASGGGAGGNDICSPDDVDDRKRTAEGRE